MNLLATPLALPIEKPIFAGLGSAWTDQNSTFLLLPTAQLLAITAYGEAGSEGAEGMMGVLNVIRNRTRESSYIDSEIYGMTGSVYHAVILKKAQFSMYNLGDPVRNIALRIAGNFKDELDVSTNLQQAYQLAQMLLAGTLADNTGNAQFYHATYVSPSWAQTIPFVGQIGSHLFYSTSPYQPTRVSAFEAGLGGENFIQLLILGIAAGLIVQIIMKRR